MAPRMTTPITGIPGQADRAAQLDLSNTARFRALLDALPDIVYLLDMDGRFIYLSEGVRNLGYAPEDLIGTHFLGIIHPDERELVSRRHVVDRIRETGAVVGTQPKLFDERRSGERMTRDLRIRLMGADGASVMHVSVNAYGEPDAGALLPVRGVGGPVTLGIARDISADIRYRDSLEENLASKEVLLREIHHRVKNNLQVVASLAHLREMESDDEVARATLGDFAVQVRSMAMAHEALYQSEQLEGVRADIYFDRFGRFLDDSYSLLGRPVLLSVRAEPAWIGVESLSNLALIANELVANAYRHAFPGGRGGRIEVRFGRSESGWELVVLDDGVGKAQAVADGRKGLGTDIVSALAKSLGATVSRSWEGGTRVTVSVPLHLASLDAPPPVR